MNIKNCPKCKKLFSPNEGQLICNECVKLEEQEFETVRIYVRENTGASINEVSEQTGVSTNKILKYLREGRLEVSDGMSDFLKCEKCAKTIRTGRYCSDCASKMEKTLNKFVSLANTEPKQTGIRMHTK